LPESSIAAEALCVSAAQTQGDTIMVLTLTRPQSLKAPAQSFQEFSLPTNAGAVEIQVQAESPADLALCRIIILQPQSPTTNRYTDRTAGFLGSTNGSGALEDEEPTWEDAAWQ
jgi:hypothetical protein